MEEGLRDAASKRQIKDKERGIIKIIREIMVFREAWGGSVILIRWIRWIIIVIVDSVGRKGCNKLIILKLNN